MVPYVPASPISQDGRNLPQILQESNFEIRTFMPRWGKINERRNQLHEVIRLSGMNIIIDDTDHPLIIKVASIPSARMQVYFIDNDDFFHKRQMMCDENGTEYADNVERAVFYARGVLETVKKLRWYPDIIFCQSWMSAVAAFYVKTAYSDEPSFANTKVLFSAYNEMANATIHPRLMECLNFRNANKEAIDAAGVDLTQPDSLGCLGVAFCDGFIEGESGAHPELITLAEKKGIPVLRAIPEGVNPADAYCDFLKVVCGDEEA